MATINSINPDKSKKTGGVPFVIDGTGFLTSDLSNDFSGGIFYTDTSINGGAINDTTDLELILDSTPGSVAAIDTNHTFAGSFDVSILIEKDLLTLPATNGAKIAALRAFDDIDPTTYFDVYLGYNDGSGYFMKVEGFITGAAVFSNTISIDPNSVQGLKIIRSQGRMTGFVKVSDTFVPVGDYLGFADFNSRIKMYAENNTVAVAGAFIINITEYKVDYVVSLVDRPATVLTFSDTEITGTTLPNELGSGDIVLGFPDGTFVEILGGFEYTPGQGLNREAANFDMTISIFNFQIDPSRNELFTSADPFVWDDNYWIRPDKQNKNLSIPSLWDPVTANLPSAFLQSGYGDGDNLELIDIKKFKAESQESWYARLNHGTYYIKNVPYYLYSNESITKQLGLETTTDGRSRQPLKFRPKPGIPISASILTTDIETGLIIDKTRFSKRGKFTGRIQNGVELDTDVVTNIDKLQSEFVVTYNSDNRCDNIKVPVNNAVAGSYIFTLPKIPIRCFGVVFNRKDIFVTEKSAASLYGEAGTIYGETLYGEALLNPGDYSINYSTGEVEVILDQEYVDLGFVSFTFDYPAVIEFNDLYIFDKGSTITVPTSSNLSSLDVIGISEGSLFQIFRLSEFPVLDFSTSQFLDPDNFNLFLYDESDNTFEADWIRVRNIKEYGPLDKVYQLNPDQGTVFFGDGINGLIPQKFKLIVAGYKTSVRLEYEPVSSVDYWVGTETDLNLSKNSLNSGFLFLSRKELIPDSISIEFSTDSITALEFAELSAIVRDKDGDVIPNIPLEFEVVNGNGNIEESSVTTNSSGEAKTIFIPSSRVEDMGIFVHAYEAGLDPFTLGDPRDIYFDTGTLINNVIVAEDEVTDDPDDIYLFKVYDNVDPFLPYDNLAREGGLYQVLHYFDTGEGVNKLIKPTSINGKVLIFDQELPQSFNPIEPNYEPNLRGFVIIGKKQIQAKAQIVSDTLSISSDIASLSVEFSPIQKGEWTLPILPITFTGSEIDRATYITINP